MKVNGSPLNFPGAALPADYALDLYYIYLLVLGVPARWRTPPFPLRKNRCPLAHCGFVTVFAAPKHFGLWHLGILQAKGNATAYPKMSSLK
jgi:hypothetical protein